MTPYHQDNGFTLWNGDALTILRELPDGSVNCAVTSPPYWGLRDYGTDGQLGLEAAPEEYVAAMVAVFREVRRILTPTGTLWLNLGDTYGGDRGNHKPAPDNLRGHGVDASPSHRHRDFDFRKQLVGIPWRVALALQADGWYLRSEIIWSKPNPMPESVTDRPTKAHEQIFLLARSARYFFDAEAVAEPARWFGPNGQPKSGPHSGQMKGRAGKGHTPASWEERKAAGAGPGNVGRSETYQGGVHGTGVSHELGNGLTRNVRSVWEIQTQQYADAHFAVFPEELARRCILAGSRKGDTILDPFLGSGTTARVALQEGRKAVGIELNAEYAEMAKRRVATWYKRPVRVKPPEGQPSLLAEGECVA